LPIVNIIFKNRWAKASEVGTTENELKYSILGSFRKIMNNPEWNKFILDIYSFILI
jgi:hypothetical protein